MILLRAKIQFSSNADRVSQYCPKIVSRSPADNLIISGSNLTGLLFGALTLATTDVITSLERRPLFELISNIVVSLLYSHPDDV